MFKSLGFMRFFSLLRLVNLFQIEKVLKHPGVRNIVLEALKFCYHVLKR